MGKFMIHQYANKKSIDTAHGTNKQYNDGHDTCPYDLIYSQGLLPRVLLAIMNKRILMMISMANMMGHENEHISIYLISIILFFPCVYEDI